MSRNPDSGDVRPIALITGTSSGFGLLTSIALAKAGYHVIATMRDVSKSQALEAAAGAAGVLPRIEISKLDVTDESDIHNVVEAALTHHGRIDVLVNNAGYAQGGFVEELTLDDWRRQFETNFFGVVALTKAVLPDMRKSRRGTIINVGSISGRFGFPAMGPYVASKFALSGFSESLRLEMLPYGVRVVLVEPASYRTEVWRKGKDDARFSADSPYAREIQSMEKSIDAMATGGGDPQDVANLIVRILQMKHPKLRYPIGKGVRGLIAAKSILPYRQLERIVASRLK